MTGVLKVKIGYARYSCSYSNSPELFKHPEDIGYCNVHEHYIAVKTGLAAPHKHEVFLHEVLHAIWDSQGIMLYQHEERVVAALTKGLMDFIADNPAVALKFVRNVVDACRS